MERRFENEVRLPRCDKNKYSKREAATIANANKRDGKRRKGRNPTRHYYCNICNAWHLTSKNEKRYKN